MTLLPKLSTTIFHSEASIFMCDDDTMANYYQDQDVIFGRYPDEPFWVTRDGRVILIREMEDAHLLNTIRMLRRGVDAYILRDVREMSSYIADAPNEAADACTMEALALIAMDADEYLERKFPDVFPHLMAQVRGRGLSI